MYAVSHSASRKVFLRACRVSVDIFSIFFIFSPHLVYKWDSKYMYRVRKMGSLMQYSCDECGKTFETRRNHPKRYCSSECRRKGYRRKRFRGIYKTCPVCGGAFTVQHSKQRIKFCSRKCFNEDRRKKLETMPRLKQVKDCEICGKPFEYYPSGRKHARFCSLRCSRIGHSRDLAGRRKAPYGHGVKAIRYRLTLLIGGDKCFLCGWNEASNDVCHIIPVKDGGKESIENMILLCPNHHRMFDRKLIQREHLASLVQTRLEKAPFVFQNRIKH